MFFLCILDVQFSSVTRLVRDGVQAMGTPALWMQLVNQTLFRFSVDGEGSPALLIGLGLELRPPQAGLGLSSDVWHLFCHHCGSVEVQEHLVCLVKELVFKEEIPCARSSSRKVDSQYQVAQGESVHLHGPPSPGGF